MNDKPITEYCKDCPYLMVNVNDENEWICGLTDEDDFICPALKDKPKQDEEGF